MTDEETELIVLYLHAGQVDWAARGNTALLRVWADQLRRVPADVGQEASRSFFAERDPKRHGFPPDVGEFCHHIDRVWSRRTAKPVEKLESFKQITDGLEQVGGSREAFGKAAVAFIKDIMDGKVTAGTPAYRERWKSLYGEEPVPDPKREQREYEGKVRVAEAHAKGTARQMPCSEVCSHATGTRI